YAQSGISRPVIEPANRSGCETTAGLPYTPIGNSVSTSDDLHARISSSATDPSNALIRGRG
ncbi:hypothetical protein, partial [Streptomyces sp. AC627_RSS907]|uniref:hypothetical protein n=1 Tax=Streptomyces sp. AC627_RSS907 TaxID=2823684 RepID=UPI001C258DE1